MMREIDSRELAAKEDRVKVLESTDPIAGLGQTKESTPKAALHYAQRELLDYLALEVMMREIDSSELAAKEDRVKVLESTDPIAGLGQTKESTPKAALERLDYEALKVMMLEINAREHADTILELKENSEVISLRQELEAYLSNEEMMHHGNLDKTPLNLSATLKDLEDTQRECNKCLAGVCRTGSVRGGEAHDCREQETRSGRGRYFA
jgi:hypothetical protein